MRYSLSCVRLFETPWTVAHQDPLSTGILQARIPEWVVVLFSNSKQCVSTILIIWITAVKLRCYSLWVPEIASVFMFKPCKGSVMLLSVAVKLQQQFDYRKTGEWARHLPIAWQSYNICSVNGYPAWIPVVNIPP